MSSVNKGINPQHPAHAQAKPALAEGARSPLRQRDSTVGQDRFEIQPPPRSVSPDVSPMLAALANAPRATPERLAAWGRALKDTPLALRESHFVELLDHANGNVPDQGFFGGRRDELVAASMNRLVELRASLPCVPTLEPVAAHLRSLLRPGMEPEVALSLLRAGAAPTSMVADKAPSWVAEIDLEFIGMSHIQAALEMFGFDNNVHAGDRGMSISANWRGLGSASTTAVRDAGLGLGDIVATIWALTELLPDRTKSMVQEDIVRAFARSVEHGNRVCGDGVVWRVFAAVQGHVDGIAIDDFEAEQSSAPPPDPNEFASDFLREETRDFPDEEGPELDVAKTNLKNELSVRVKAIYGDDAQSINKIHDIVDAYLDYL